MLTILAILTVMTWTPMGVLGCYNEPKCVIWGAANKEWHGYWCVGFKCQTDQILKMGKIRKIEDEKSTQHVAYTKYFVGCLADLRKKFSIELRICFSSQLNIQQCRFFGRNDAVFIIFFFSMAPYWPRTSSRVTMEKEFSPEKNS